MARYWLDSVGAGLAGVSGPAAGPVDVDGWQVVGEVTLHDPGRLGPPPHGVPTMEHLARGLIRRGPSALAGVDGMFTLALRAPDGRLVTVRDQVGTRTAYRARTPAGWVVASSLRALRARAEEAGLSWRVDVAAVSTFLTFAYLPGEQTLVEGVAELLPGKVTTLHPDGSVRVEDFWEPQDAIARRTPEEHAAHLRRALERAVTDRLPPGEPVAATLSGGVDSSLVTALAARLHDRPVHTYSIGFGADMPHELAYSGLVATHCGTTHRVLHVGGDRIAARLAETVALLDNPVGDPLTVPNLELAEAVAGDGLTVALNGEGGDPVFGGPKNRPMLLFELHRSDPAPDARARAYVRSYRKCGEDLPRLLTAEALAVAATPTHLVQPWLDGPMAAQLDRLLHTNLRTKGAHHILPKVERLTAACGVEARAPLFARPVVDAAFTVPPRLKLRGDQEKWILKEAVADLLPATILHRPKSGMRVPVQQWLRGPLRDLAADALLSRTAVDRGLLRRESITDWLRHRGSLYPRHGAKVWLALTLELWLRAHVDGESAASTVGAAIAATSTTGRFRHRPTGGDHHEHARRWGTE